MAYTTRSVVDACSDLKSRSHIARDFIVNRVLRVVPLYWLATAWAARSVYPHLAIADVLKDFAFIPRLGTPWAIYPVLVQGWTLNYEMFFYLLFAASLLTGRYCRELLIGAIVTLVAIGTVWTFHLGILASDASTRWYGDAHGGLLVLPWFYTNNIMLEFCFGIALEALCHRHAFPDWARWRYCLLWLAGFAGLAVLHLHWPRGLLQGVPATLIVWCSIPACRGLQLRIPVLLGNASYAIYLFHWTGFAALKPWVGHLGAVGGSLPEMVAVMIALGLAACLLGVALHLWVEKPITRWLKLHFGRRPSADSLPGASP